MPIVIDYILKLNICFAVVYLFYQLLLRKLTFYNWNRWYLLGYTALSFFIPLIDIMPSLQKRAPDSIAALQWIPVISLSGTEPHFFDSLSSWDWTLAVLILGILLMLCRFLVRYLSFRKMKAKACLISEGDTNIYQLEGDMRPFSFGNAIFINMEMHNGQDLEEIIRHEFVHVKQHHTIDILWCELLCILNWFNPFVWALRQNVKQNLEFIADNQVLQHGIDKKEYQYLLLKVMGNRQFAFTNHFNFSSLKRRIAMMNTIKSASIHLVKFMFLLPVVAVTLLSFRKEVIRITDIRLATIRDTHLSPVDTSKNEMQSSAKSLSPLQSKVSIKDTASPVKKELRGTNDNAFSAKSEPLIVVNGVVMAQSYKLETIDPNHIKTVSVLKGENAASLYGSEAADGVVVITTNTDSDGTTNHIGLNADKELAKNSTTQKGFGVIANNDSGNFTHSVKENERLHFVHVYSDTVPAVGQTSSDVKDLVVVGYLSKDAKASGMKGKAEDVEGHSPVKEVVVKGYGVRSLKQPVKKEDAATTEKPKDVIEIHYRKEADKADETNVLRIVGRAELSNDPYYILNGEKVKRKDIENLHPDQIKSIKVLKGEKATASYGKKAREGTIIISTR